MISIKRSLNEYERVQCLASGLTETVRATLKCLGQYVIETEPSLVEHVREWAEGLAGTFEACINVPAESSLYELRTSIRAGLRDYRDRAGRYIHELKERVAATTAAMNEMMATLQSGDSDGETQLKSEIKRLSSLEAASNLEDLRAGLHRGIASLTACMTQLRQEKQVIIAQLRDEIRTLQQTLDDARRSATTDNVTGAYNRKEFERLLTRSVASERTKSIIRLRVCNLLELGSRNRRETLEQLLGAVCGRIRAAVPEEAVVGQWQEDTFCVLLRSADSREVMSELTRRCGGNYVCMEGTQARTLGVEVAVTSFTCSPGAPAERTIQILDNFASTESRGTRNPPAA